MLQIARCCWQVIVTFRYNFTVIVTWLHSNCHVGGARNSLVLTRRVKKAQQLRTTTSMYQLYRDRYRPLKMHWILKMHPKKHIVTLLMINELTYFYHDCGFGKEFSFLIEKCAIFEYFGSDLLGLAAWQRKRTLPDVAKLTWT